MIHPVFRSIASWLNKIELVDAHQMRTKWHTRPVAAVCPAGEATAAIATMTAISSYFKVTRHVVLSLCLSQFDRLSSLPGDWRLDPADRGEVEVIARSEQGWHLAWLDAGATCWLGRIEGETAFRTWTAQSAAFIRQVIPWVEQSERPAYVFDVETRDDMRRRRIAARFLAEALRRLTSAGVQRAWVRIEPGNLPSRRLFADLGFHEQALLTELSLRGHRLLWRQTSAPPMPQ